LISSTVSDSILQLSAAVEGRPDIEHKLEENLEVLEEAVEGEAAPEPLHAVACQVCDRRLMGVSFPVVYRPETLGNLNLVHQSEEGAWCGYCRQVTVFVHRDGTSWPQPSKAATASSAG
jgi:hypothetical protein